MDGRKLQKKKQGRFWKISAGKISPANSIGKRNQSSGKDRTRLWRTGGRGGEGRGSCISLQRKGGGGGRQLKRKVGGGLCWSLRLHLWDYKAYFHVLWRASAEKNLSQTRSKGRIIMNPGSRETSRQGPPDTEKVRCFPRREGMLPQRTPASPEEKAEPWRWSKYLELGVGKGIHQYYCPGNFHSLYTEETV